MMNTTLLGDWGESRACGYLRRKGYRIISRNYHSRFGEVDIIATKNNVISFVEVKLRKDDSFASAREFVTPSKCNKIKTTASMYLSSNPTDLQPRFDVIEIYAPKGRLGRIQIEHIENAFC